MSTAPDYGQTPTRTLWTPYGDAARVSTKVFLDRFLPALPPGVDLGIRVASLRRRRKLWRLLVAKNDRLWGYSRRDPFQAEPSCAFTPLQTCYQRLATALPGRNALSFINNADGSWNLYERDEDALPDAWLE